MNYYSDAFDLDLGVSIYRDVVDRTKSKITDLLQI